MERSCALRSCDHPNVALIQRWSDLYINIEHIRVGICKAQSLYAGGLYMQVTFRAGLSALYPTYVLSNSAEPVYRGHEVALRSYTYRGRFDLWSDT